MSRLENPSGINPANLIVHRPYGWLDVIDTQIRDLHTALDGNDSGWSEYLKRLHRLDLQFTATGLDAFREHELETLKRLWSVSKRNPANWSADEIEAWKRSIREVKP